MSNSIALFLKALKEKIICIFKKYASPVVGAALLLMLCVIGLMQAMIGPALYRNIFKNSSSLHGNRNERLETRRKAAKSWFQEEHFYGLWQIQSRDKLNLRAYFLPASSSSEEVVILLHGYHQTPEDLFELAKIYHEHFDFHILIPGLRGQAPSEGEAISFGWHDQHDLQDWIQLLQKRLSLQPRVILHGISSGAATAIMAASPDLSSSIIAVIADSSFDRLEDFIKNEYRGIFSGILGPFLFRKTDAALRKAEGFQMSEMLISKQLQDCQVPLLLIHGLQDQIVLPSVAYELKAAPGPAGSKRLLALFKEAGHAENFYTNSKSYEKAIACFLQPEISPRSFFPTAINPEPLKIPPLEEMEDIEGTQWVI